MTHYNTSRRLKGNDPDHLHRNYLKLVDEDAQLHQSYQLLEKCLETLFASGPLYLAPLREKSTSGETTVWYSCCCRGVDIIDGLMETFAT